MKPFRYVQSFVDRKTGAVFHYFRRRGCPRIRLPGVLGSREFMEAYQIALDGPQMPIGAARTKAGTINAAIVGYYQSRSFAELAPGTQAIRRQILERFRADHGDRPVDMPPKFIRLTLDKMKPAPARNWFKAIRTLMAYAVKADMMAANPTTGIEIPKVKSKPHRAWTDEEIATYELAHPIGTKARLAVALGIYTAQRRSDVIRMGRQHLRDGFLQVTAQQKTGTAVDVPVIPKLRAVIDATPSNHLTFLTTKTGRPYRPNEFSVAFRKWCDEARLPKDCDFHGLRYATAKLLAEAGCTAFEIASITGHKTLAMVQKYTAEFERRQMAKSAMAKLTRNDSETN
jgi:integrase